MSFIDVSSLYWRSGMRKYINKNSPCTKGVWLTEDDTGRMYFGQRTFLTVLGGWGWPSRHLQWNFQARSGAPDQAQPGPGGMLGRNLSPPTPQQASLAPFLLLGPRPWAEKSHQVDGGVGLCLGVHQWIPTTLQSPCVPLTCTVIFSHFKYRKSKKKKSAPSILSSGRIGQVGKFKNGTLILSQVDIKKINSSRVAKWRYFIK